MPHDPKKKKTKRKKNIKKQYCNKFNKGFLNGPYKKKIFKTKKDYLLIILEKKEFLSTMDGGAW